MINKDKAREALDYLISAVTIDCDCLTNSECTCEHDAQKAIQTIYEALQPKAVDVEALKVTVPTEIDSRNRYEAAIHTKGWNDCVDSLHQQGHLCTIPDGYVCKKQLIEKLRGMNHIDLKVGGATQRAFGQNEGYNQAIDTIIAELENEDE